MTSLCDDLFESLKHSSLECIHTKSVRKRSPNEYRSDILCPRKRSMASRIVSRLSSLTTQNERKETLFLWSGYEEGSLDLSLLVSKQIGHCTVEMSNLANEFVRLHGGWNNELESIRSKYRVSLEEATLVRKCIWDRISKEWASQGKHLVVAILSKRVDLNKTLYSIELPSVSPSSKVALFMCDCSTGFVFLLKNRILSKREALRTVRLFTLR
jgi:hypothetical protein